MDALAEERRMRDVYRARWEKSAWELKKEVERRRREVNEREGGRWKGSYYVNGLEPIGTWKGGAEVLEGVLEGMQQVQVTTPGGGERRLAQTAPSGSAAARRRIPELDRPATSVMGDVMQDADATELWEARTEE
ncbi:hypothetical protein HDU98_008399 [Podochytrium sp. JEL0797]|nr:hypothetical protein HDU98_008399 [Podochytrium sp. JEL0797]